MDHSGNQPPQKPPHNGSPPHPSNDNNPQRPPNCIPAMLAANAAREARRDGIIELFESRKASLSTLARFWLDYLFWLDGPPQPPGVKATPGE